MVNLIKYIFYFIRNRYWYGKYSDFSPVTFNIWKRIQEEDRKRKLRYAALEKTSKGMTDEEINNALWEIHQAPLMNWLFENKNLNGKDRSEHSTGNN